MIEIKEVYSLRLIVLVDGICTDVLQAFMRVHRQPNRIFVGLYAIGSLQRITWIV